MPQNKDRSVDERDSQRSELNEQKSMIASLERDWKRILFFDNSRNDFNEIKVNTEIGASHPWEEELKDRLGFIDK